MAPLDPRVVHALRLRDPRDTVPDFSFAGYDSNRTPIPSIRQVARTVHPSPRPDVDRTADIQSALDDVGGAGGGVVVLSAGDYVLSSTSLEIRHSGVVLRGQGDATVLWCLGAPRNVVDVGSATATGSAKLQRGSSTIVEAYVPLGATSVAVESASSFRAGQEVCLRRRVSKAWISVLGMDKLVRDGKQQTWMKEGTCVDQIRTIAHVQGNRIFWEVPLTDPIDSRWNDVPSLAIFYDPPRRVRQCGVESLCFRQSPSACSTPVASQNLQPLGFGAAEDCWARRIHAVGFCQFALFAKTARRVTLADFTVERDAPTSNGGKGALPLDVTISGTQILVLRGRTLGRNDTASYVVSTGSQAHGPNVVTGYLATGCNRHIIEPHQRWATGLLVDNSTAGRIKMGNRGILGSGQGWSMAAGIVWGCHAGDCKVDVPPVSSENLFVRPSPSLPPSLVLAQLSARLNDEGQALAILGRPASLR